MNKRCVKVDGIDRMLAEGALLTPSPGRLGPTLKQIYNHVRKCPHLAFRFAEILVKRHGWKLKRAARFIENYYKPLK